jgi:uncharacterized protein YbjQ (UPF0145 family)
MANETARLTLEIDSRDIERAMAALREFERGSRRTRTETSRLQRELSATEEAFQELGRGVEAATTMAVVAATAIGAAMTAIGVASLSAATDMEETQGKFDVVFRGMTDTAEGWAKDLQENYALSEKAGKHFLSSIQDLIVPTGMLREEAGALSNKFVQLAVDLASFNNFTEASVIRDFQSALAGGSDTLTKFGISAQVADIKQKALTMGFMKGGAELTKAERTLVLYQLSVEGSSDALGDLSRTSAGLANQKKKLKSNIDDLSVAIGRHLIPEATRIVTAVNDWYKANEKLINQDIASFFKKVATAAGATIETVSTLGDVIAGIGIALQQKSVSVADVMFGNPDEAKKRVEDFKSGLFELLDIREKARRTQQESARDLKDEQSRWIVINDELHQKQLQHFKDVHDNAKMLVGVYDDQIALITEQSSVVGSQVIAQTKFKVVVKETVDAVEELDEAEGKLADTIVDTVAVTQEQLDVFSGMGLAMRDMASAQYEAISGAFDDTDEALDEFFGDVDQMSEEATQQMTEDWMLFTESVKVEVADGLTKVLQGEFSSWEEALDATLDYMLNSFLTTIADMAANAVVDIVFNTSGGGGGGGVGGMFDDVGEGIGDWFAGDDSWDWDWGWGDDSGGDSWFDGWADGGFVTGGSGTRDDILAGVIGGRPQMVKGGEFIMPPEATRDNRDLLEMIRMGAGPGRRPTPGQILPPRNGRGERDGATEDNTDSTDENTEKTETATEKLETATEQTEVNTDSTDNNSTKTEENSWAMDRLHDAMGLASEAMRGVVETGFGMFGGMVGAGLGSVAGPIGSGYLGAKGARIGAKLGDEVADKIWGEDDWDDMTPGERAEKTKEVDRALSDFFDPIDRLGRDEMRMQRDRERNDQGVGADWGRGGPGSGDLGGGGPVGDQSSSGEATGPGRGGTPGIGGYADGGVIDKLIVPGEDGLAPVQFGEGVITKKGMQMLDNINSGNLGGQNIKVTMPIVVGGKKVQQYILSIVDGHIDVRESRGTVGRVSY